MSSMTVSNPTSAPIKISSSSSKNSSSTFRYLATRSFTFEVKLFRVLLNPSLNFPVTSSLDCVNLSFSFLKKLTIHLPHSLNIHSFRPACRSLYASNSSCVSCSLTDTSFETPDSCMVTPYSTWASSIVPLRWVMTMNCVSSLNLLQVLAETLHICFIKCCLNFIQDAEGDRSYLQDGKQQGDGRKARSPPDISPRF